MTALESREYKMMLKASCFAGDKKELRAQVSALWVDLTAIIAPHAVAVTGTDDVEHRRRRVRFVDTPEHRLRKNDYVLRERIKPGKKKKGKKKGEDEHKITLKFRHPDRYFSQDRDMQSADKKHPDTKFEEDIKPRFYKLFSYSSSVVVKGVPTLKCLGDVANLFPGLPREIDGYSASAPLKTVGHGFVAWELVVKGTSFQIGSDPEVMAECSVTLWYAKRRGKRPVVAEFSFKYDGDENEYSGKMSHRAYGVYLAIQDHLHGWLAPDSLTKTAYVYQR